jgi:ABC-type multidrug transport system fused ATPase/permease subunit
MSPVRNALLPFARPHRGILGRGLVWTCLLVGARLALPLPLVAVVQRASPSGADSAGFPAALLSAAFVALALLAGLAEHHQRLAFAHFAGRAIADGRDAALARVQADRGDPSGDLTAQVVGDALRAKQCLKGVLNHITVNGLLVIGVCVALAVTDLWLGLVQLVGALLLIVVAMLGAAGVGSVAAEHRDREASLAGSVHRLASGGSGPVDVHALAALRELDADSGIADVAMTRREGVTTWVVHVVLVASAAGVLVLGVHGVRSGQLTTAALFGVMAYLLVLHGPAIRFARQITRTAPLLVSARQLALAIGAHDARRASSGRVRETPGDFGRS